MQRSDQSAFDASSPPEEIQSPREGAQAPAKAARVPADVAKQAAAQPPSPGTLEGDGPNGTGLQGLSLLRGAHPNRSQTLWALWSQANVEEIIAKALEKDR